MKKPLIVLLLVSSVLFSQSNKFDFSSASAENGEHPEAAGFELTQENGNSLAISQLQQVIYANGVQTTDDYNFDLLNNIPEKKSPWIAIAYSVLLPGMGELYGGDYSLGKYLTIADGFLWTGLTGMHIYSGWQEDNYKAFAKSSGGVNTNGKDDQFFADIGSYINVDDFNDDKALNGQFELMYDASTHGWNWNDNLTRSEYREMWESSESASNNIQFVVGALIINRIVSAINAVRVVSAYNDKVENGDWNISVGYNNYKSMPGNVTLNFVTSF